MGRPAIVRTATRKDYASVAQFVRAVKRNEIPEDIVSPGCIAAHAGVTRQAVHDAIKKLRMDSWHIEGGYVFVRKSGADVFERV